MKRILVQAITICAASTLAAIAYGSWLGWSNIAPPPPSATCDSPTGAQTAVLWVTPQTAKQWFDESVALFVDARDSSAYANGHITNAIHCPPPPNGQPPRCLEQAIKASIVVAYCDTIGSCARSTKLAEALAHAGVVEVRVLEGGLPQWITLGFPAEAGQCRDCILTP